MKNVPIMVVILVLVAVAARAAPPDIAPMKNAGDPNTPFGASLGVDISVAPWASVEWGAESMDIQIMSPDVNQSDGGSTLGWFRNVDAQGNPRTGNWGLVPLHIGTNTDITVLVYEGLGKLLVDNGIPSECVFGQPNVQKNDAIFEPAASPAREYFTGMPACPTSAPPGVLLDTIDTSIGANLPESTGCNTGGMARIYFDYAEQKASGPSGKSAKYGGGQFTIYPAIGIRTHDRTFTAEDEKVYQWTSLSSEFEGTAKIWAIVVPGELAVGDPLPTWE
jgi:hypothetical protein